MEEVGLRAVSAALMADQKGATAIEYALIAALIVIASMGVLTKIGGDLRSLFNCTGQLIGHGANGPWCAKRLG